MCNAICPSFFEGGHKYRLLTITIPVPTCAMQYAPLLRGGHKYRLLTITIPVLICSVYSWSGIAESAHGGTSIKLKYRFKLKIKLQIFHFNTNTHYLV